MNEELWTNIINLRISAGFSTTVAIEDANSVIDAFEKRFHDKQPAECDDCDVCQKQPAEPQPTFRNVKLDDIGMVVEVSDRLDDVWCERKFAGFHYTGVGAMKYACYSNISGGSGVIHTWKYARVRV